MAGPLAQFEVHSIGPELSLAGFNVPFNNSALWMVIAVVEATGLMIAATARQAVIPGRLQSLAEVLHGFVANMVRENAGQEGMKYFPFVFSLFIFVLFGYLRGMIPFSFTFTSHIIVTFGLAATVFVAVTVIALMRHGMHFFSFFLPHGTPWWMAIIVIPIEILSYFARPVSLSIRLFANMMAGHTMLKVFGGFAVSLGIIGGLAPLALIVALTGFEILVALLQAYVFSILTCLYLKDAIELH